jgi:hypothetical protein
LDKVLTRCAEVDLVFNWEKCHFIVKQGIVLGHVISERGIEVDKAKVETVEQLPPLTDVKSLRSFLGHAGFYRRFIKDFSKITKPLTNLLQKDVAFDFDEKCLAAFQTLKSTLVTAPIIQPPDWSQPFEIMCDASVVWTSLGPLPRWVPGPTTRWAPGTTRLGLHDTCWREAQGPRWRSTRIGSYACPIPCRELLDIHD